MANTKAMQNRSGFGTHMKRNMPYYVMLIIPMAYFIIFRYWPMFGLSIAFQNYKPFKGIAKSKFVGLEHFQEFLTGTYAWRTIRNTLVISLLQILIGFPICRIAASSRCSCSCARSC